MEELVLIDKKPVEEGFPLRALFSAKGCSRPSAAVAGFRFS